MEQPWKLLEHPPSEGAWNMAVDQYLMEDSNQWIRLYQWIRPTLSLGYFQKISEIESQPLDSGEVDLVRRLTGGKAVLHQHELTYSVTAFSDSFPGELLKSYRAIGNALIEGLDLLGVKAELVERKPAQMEGGNCFQVPGWYEVTYQGKKLIGSAQTRRKGRLLQHGSLLVDRDDPLIRRLFAHDAEEELGMLSLKEIMKTVPPMEEIRLAMVQGFQKSWGIDLPEEKLPEASQSAIEDFRNNRYLRDEWKKKR